MSIHDSLDHLLSPRLVTILNREGVYTLKDLIEIAYWKTEYGNIRGRMRSIDGLGYKSAVAIYNLIRSHATKDEIDQYARETKY